MIAAQLAEVCARLEPFDAELSSVGRFPGGVVWLRPTPHERFVAMLVAVQQPFPHWRPYGGTYDEPVPHLTVASGVDDATADTIVQLLVTRLRDRGPVTSPVRELTLLEEAHDLHWTVGRSWALGPTSSVRTG